MSEATSTKLGETLRNIAIKLLVGAATAIGVVGAVATVGGGISWLRFRKAGLPAQRAVEVLPNEDLVVVGATGLIGFIGLGVVAVVALFVLDPKGTVSDKTRLGLTMLAAAAAIYTVCWTELEPLSESALVALAVLLAIACRRVAHETGDRFGWFGVAVFASVFVFGTASWYRIEMDDARVFPAAVLRPTDTKKSGLIGVFVAAAPDKIYLGRIAWQTGQPAALYEIERPPGTRLAVGARTKRGNARAIALALREQLVRDRPRPIRPQR